jgi:thiol-disulfide isomerase/thioredoxin
MRVRRPLVGVVLLSIVGTLGTGSLSSQSPAPTAASPTPTPMPPLAAGDVIAPFQARGYANETPLYTVDFPKTGPTTVLLIFLSTCPHCHKMIPVWNKALEKKPKDLKVLGIMLDEGGPGFFQAFKIVFPVLRPALPTEFANLLKIRNVPMTIRIKPGGIVESIAVGDPDAAKVPDLFR